MQTAEKIHLLKRIEILENSLAEMTERHTQFLKEMKLDLPDRTFMRFTPYESKIFWLLMARPSARFSQLNIAVYDGSPTEGCEYVVKVLVHYMRKKMKMYGLEIKTIWGQGYSIPHESKERFLKLVEHNKNEENT